MKVTVITICFNAENHIEKTIRSVLGQTYDNIEYLIIDGCSSDNTLKIIRKYENYRKIICISEKDSGIYNAMNKGIDNSTGEYVIFMNAGDVFFNRRVVANLVRNIYMSNADVIWGNALLKFQSRKQLLKIRKLSLKLFIGGGMPSHQATIAKTKLLKEMKFNESYLLRADFDWFVRCYRKSIIGKCKLQMIDMTVCIYLQGGASDRPKNIQKLRKETIKSIKSNFYLLYLLNKKKMDNNFSIN